MILRRTLTHLLLAAVGMAICSMPVLAESAAANDSNCSTAREFIIAHQYLTEHKEFGLTPQDAMKMARQVARGCSGAALRFTMVSDLLLLAQMPSKEAVQIGMTYASKSEMEAHAFVQVFRFAYLDSGMDLDPRSALTLTRSLTTDFKGDIRLVREDFFVITRYCSKNAQIDISREDCGHLASRIVKAAEKFNGGVADSFVRLVEFLVDSKQGPKIPVRDAFRESESLLRGGAAAAENFISAYKYGLAKNGLDLPLKDAMQFARELALAKN